MPDNFVYDCILDISVQGNDPPPPHFFSDWHVNFNGFSHTWFLSFSIKSCQRFDNLLEDSCFLPNNQILFSWKVSEILKFLFENEKKSQWIQTLKINGNSENEILCTAVYLEFKLLTCIALFKDKAKVK